MTHLAFRSGTDPDRFYLAFSEASLPPGCLAKLADDLNATERRLISAMFAVPSIVDAISRKGFYLTPTRYTNHVQIPLQLGRPQ